MRFIDSLTVLALSLILFSCNNTSSQPVDKTDEEGGDEEEVVETRDVVAYVTKADRSKLYERSTFDFAKPGSMSPNQIKYSEDPDSPEVDGFGIAITTATAYNLLKMKQEDRTAFLTELFSKDKGAGSSLIRVSIGASDFCVGEEYTWCDTRGLENFAVAQEDKNLLFPVLKEIYSINPEVKIIGSPWSAPRWMKGGGSWGYEGYDAEVLEKDYPQWTSGRLKPSCYADYAQYFIKWIQAMESEGFDIYAITTQNEPLNHGNSMSMYMPWKDQRDFIKVLGPALEEAGLGDVKILLFDHNYNYDGKEDQKGYPLNIYADEQAGKWAAGSAWHNYGGSVNELDRIRDAYPQKDIFFTEASIGEWNYNFSSCLLNDFSTIFLGTLLRGGKGVTLWNLMLDDKNSPHSPKDGACKTCFGAVTISSHDYKTITRNSQWYNVLHSSAVIKPGARMMNVEGWTAPVGVECQMFHNPDNSVGVILCSQNDSEQSIVISNDKFTVNFKLPSKSIASLIWNE
ncbi:MAG: glycoside hydrolase family 30 beta sandwich domain-containing protein [Candidatus Cryptobacteroides sp.]